MPRKGSSKDLHDGHTESGADLAQTPSMTKVKPGYFFFCKTSCRWSSSCVLPARLVHKRLFWQHACGCKRCTVWKLALGGFVSSTLRNEGLGFYFLFGRARRCRDGLVESHMCRHYCHAGPPPPAQADPLWPSITLSCDGITWSCDGRRRSACSLSQRRLVCVCVCVWAMEILSCFFQEISGLYDWWVCLRKNLLNGDLFFFFSFFFFFFLRWWE